MNLTKILFNVIDFILESELIFVVIVNQFDRVAYTLKDDIFLIRSVLLDGVVDQIHDNLLVEVDSRELCLIELISNLSGQADFLESFCGKELSSPLSVAFDVLSDELIGRDKEKVEFNGQVGTGNINT